MSTPEPALAVEYRSQNGAGQTAALIRGPKTVRKRGCASGAEEVGQGGVEVAVLESEPGRP